MQWICQKRPNLTKLNQLFPLHCPIIKPTQFGIYSDENVSYIENKFIKVAQKEYKRRRTTVDRITHWDTRTNFTLSSTKDKWVIYEYYLQSKLKEIELKVVKESCNSDR